MRPLKLELKGFTAFRDAATLDLTGLDLFAIAGPTGSGKSSLLDAMTYALYGRVERVGDRVGQLISQGQPRMAVSLEFGVGPDHYRVTRSTGAKGATRILLERFRHGEWTQAGEGADRVREADQLIKDVVGLPYDGFTRSVLLPQGKFQEFLVGDAKKRRDLLSDLLDLERFRRMAERAGAMARESSSRAQTLAEVLGGEFAGVTPGALRDAKGAARVAEKRERALARAAREVSAVAKRWERERSAFEELRGLIVEVRDLSAQAQGAAGELGDLADQAKISGAELRRTRAAGRRASDAEARASKARAEAEGSWGPLAVLIQARTRAEGLLVAERAADALRGRLREARESVPKLALMLEKARAGVRRCRRRLEQAEGAVLRRQAALDKAQAHDQVSALLAGRKPGDPCPVCGKSLGALPRRPGADAVAKARAAMESARGTVQATHEDLVETEKAVEAAAKDLEAAVLAEQRLVADGEERERELTGLVAELQAVLGARSPLDPLAELSARATRLQGLMDAETRAGEASRQADIAWARAEHERDRIASAVLQARARLQLDLGPLLKRASRAAGEGIELPAMPLLPSTLDPGSAGAFAAELGKALGGLAGSLEGALDGRRRAGRRFLEEARALVPAPVPEAGDLQDLVEMVDAAARAATAEAATATHRASDLEERIERRSELERDSAEATSRASRFRALATELRADRLVAFLQAEALQVLATAGSERLAGLSDGRYRLVCREDEFSVVDTWNGEDERSARTLSGGETFLASLALALALSEQVRSLSVTERARLDSLFLDEGFGTLDAESLRIVVEAIEQLGGDGRLVGVITHVRDLAERFPRIEVHKSPRGSRLEFVA